ncbi:MULTISPECIES: hypothetical protein [unclassified Pseudomonas]|uniref:hypothetical protein n=1 Tax=unclassified Pseudomonas TaxID=196821 RepID=UPI000871904F|nr:MULTISPECIES: hypothetical protein [unclassified Pseudomonas]SCW84636.1 hypothetical protein SAMN03159481_02864 [Pseudomonas sp. NFACC56-3]SFL10587.1 hypothetical protein SAMN03159473_05742 [Pseudomonas sp. NFACC52]
MAAREIRISIEDLDRDSSPEVLFEFYTGTKVDFATSVSSSSKNGKYDKVDVKGDADGDGDFDAQDDELFINLARSVVALLK